MMTLAERLKAEGMEVGLEKGREAERQAMAKAMLSEDADPAFVAKITGLSPEKIGV